MTTYLPSRTAGLLKYFMMCVSLLLILALVFALFTPSVFAYNLMSLKKIVCWLGGVIAGEIAWNGVKWVANEALKAAIAAPAVAAAVATAAAVAGIVYFVFFTKWDTLPTPYNASNAYWDYNNRYWVYPSFAPTEPGLTSKKYAGEVLC